MQQEQEHRERLQEPRQLGPQLSGLWAGRAWIQQRALPLRDQWVDPVLLSTSIPEIKAAVLAREAAAKAAEQQVWVRVKVRWH
eukprot:1157960-Pelagomonas_calceolata.AAC.5